jgi:lipopolysaccharide export LptBFGC system permease protein LptF
VKKILIILLYSFLGWAFCAAIMGIGPAYLPMDRVLIIHVIAGPLAFACLSWHYHRHFRYTKPLATALVFVSFIMLMDFFLVALVILKSLDMFRSPLGTWIPFGLIFLSTYVTGLNTRKK